MKNTLKYSVLAALAAALFLFSGCQVEKLDTDQFSDRNVTLAAIAPNPVMRGAQLRIVGSNLQNVSAVKFAGDVSVTSIETVASGARSEIRVTVPLEGPEVGPVSVVTLGGETISTRFDLTYTEPITVESVSPEVALSGDVITIKGEYLNNVKEVIFGDIYITEFVSQSRHELQVELPHGAVTGYVVVGDVDELVDKNTIPNLIYSPNELIVGDPTVVKAPKATYKAGDVIYVEGEHLDMIETITLPGVSDWVVFVVGLDKTMIAFDLPAAAGDGEIVLTSFAGKDFVAGEIETVSVSDVAIRTLAEDGRYKAGCEVEITGNDLDLVTKVDFVNAAASWFYQDGSIFATLPAEAKDGSVTLTLDSGKQAWTDEIEVVKPVITAYDGPDAVAGETMLGIGGDDLDLVVSAKIGTKEQGFFDCPFTYIVDPVQGVLNLGVEVPREAYTAPITLTAANGYETQTGTINVSYNEAVTIFFDQESYAMSKPITITGENLLKIDEIYIKGNKVTNYLLRADDAMAFNLPDGVGPGVYRLGITLLSGQTLTWSVPFAVTAPYTETFIFEGYADLGNWSNQPYFGGDGELGELGVKVGDQIRIYYKPWADWWQFQIFGGHWEGMTFPEVGGGNTVSADNTDPGAEYFTFEVTEANVGILASAPQGWGGSLLTQGEGVAITGVSLVQFGETEKVIWEGSEDLADWSNQPYLGAEGILAEEGLQVGSTVRIYFSTYKEDWQMQVFGGHWEGLSFPELGGGNEVKPSTYDASAGYFEFEVTADKYVPLTSIQGWGGSVVVQGAGVIVTKLTIQ